MFFDVDGNGVWNELGVDAWALEVGLQSFGNLNGLGDGGTLPICTSDMRAYASELVTVGDVVVSLLVSDV